MELEHKAIMEAARKEGLMPMEMASELLLHDLVQAVRAQMSRYEVGYNKMTEKQQDAVLAELQANLKDAALVAARVLASAGTPTVEMKLKDLKVANGTVTGLVAGDQKHYNELISKVQDKSDVLIVLYERDYFDALDNIQPEKDQRALPLDGEEKPTNARKPRATKPKDAEKPAIELPAKLVTDAAEFIIKQQNTTLGGIQNHLKIGTDKAKAVLEKMVELEVIERDSESATGFKIVRKQEAEQPADTEQSTASSVDFSDLEDTSQFNAGAEQSLSEDLYQNIKAVVIKKQAVSVGAIAVAHDISEELAKQAVQQLEDDLVISEEDEMGGRSVLMLA